MLTAVHGGLGWHRRSGGRGSYVAVPYQQNTGSGKLRKGSLPTLSYLHLEHAGVSKGAAVRMPWSSAWKSEFVCGAPCARSVNNP